MSTLPSEVRGALAERVTVTEDTLVVDLVDGRTVSVPLSWYPRLAHGTPAERAHWRLIGRGEGSLARSRRRHQRFRPSCWSTLWGDTDLSPNLARLPPDDSMMEISALHEPAGEAVQLDEAAAHCVDAPAAGGHVGLVVADDRGGEAAEGRGAAAATAEEPHEQAEVAPVGLDRHRAEPLLHHAVLEEARVEGGQRHGVAGA